MTDEARKSVFDDADDENEPHCHKCEACDDPLPEDLEGCHCDDEGLWFCGTCWKTLLEEAQEGLS